jgi:methanethiol oxidase
MVEVSRDGKRVYLTNSITPPGTTSSTRTASAPGWPSWTPTPTVAASPSTIGSSQSGDQFRGLRVHQTRLQAGDASSDSYCYTS